MLDSANYTPRLKAQFRDTIKAALKEFQAAQAQLDPLNARYPEHHELERRQQELAQLVIDCMRRLRIDD